MASSSGDQPRSKRRAALVAVALIAGVVVAAFALGVVGLPEVGETENSFGEVTTERTLIETELVVSNPNPFGVTPGGVSTEYTVWMNDVEAADGGAEDLNVGAGNTTVELETRMRNDAIPAWWASHIERGERTTVGIDATLTSGLLGLSTDVTDEQQIRTDILGEFNSTETRPVNADRPVGEGPVLYVNETRAEWGEVTEAETPIEMEFVMYNPNPEPVPLTQLEYDITMNGITVGEGRTEESHVIPPGETETVAATTVIDNDRLVEWWVTHLDADANGHQVTELRIEFAATLELPVGGAIVVPLDELTYEETIRTDMFDEGLHEDAPDDGNAGDGTDGPEDGENETEDGENETENGENDTGDGGLLRAGGVRNREAHGREPAGGGQRCLSRNRSYDRSHS